MMNNKIPVIYPDQLPEYIKKSIEYDGFSLYKGVVVVWDPDQDTRILDLIDTMPDSQLQNLILAHETKGTLTTLWKKGVPRRFKRREIYFDGDNWDQSHMKYVLHIKR